MMRIHLRQPLIPLAMAFLDPAEARFASQVQVPAEHRGPEIRAEEDPAARGEDRRLGVAVVDHIDSGMSAVYTFYDPAEEERSLGEAATEEMARLVL